MKTANEDYHHGSPKLQLCILPPQNTSPGLLWNLLHSGLLRVLLKLYYLKKKHSLLIEMEKISVMVQITQNVRNRNRTKRLYLTRDINVGKNIIE